MPTSLIAAAILLIGAEPVNADTFIKPGRQVEHRLEVTTGSGDEADDASIPY